MAETMNVRNAPATSFSLDVESRALEEALQAIASQLARLGKGAGIEGDGAVLQLAQQVGFAGREISDALCEVALAIRAQKGAERDQA